MARAGRRGATRKAAGSARSTAQPRWLWLVGGGCLLLGALLGYGIYLVQTKWPAHRETTTAAESKAADAKPKPAPARKDVKDTKDAKDPEQRRFDFYTLLPEMEVHITDEKFKQALRSPPRSAEPESYILQIGSFRRMQEADALKARLALLGLEANIQTVVIRNDDIWYRVRVGPYDSAKEVSQVGARLRKNDIDFVLLRLGA